jgi:hypothetical protein
VAIISSYPDDSSTTASDKFLTYDSGGATKLTPASTLSAYVNSAVTGITASQINFGGAGSGIWWQEIGRTTLGTAGDTITVSSLAARKYLRLIFTLLPTGGTIAGIYRFNGDSAANYAYVYAQDGAGDTGGFSQTSLPFEPTTAAAVTIVGQFDIVNITAQEKTVIRIYK